MRCGRGVSSPRALLLLLSSPMTTLRSALHTPRRCRVLLPWKCGSALVCILAQIAATYFPSAALNLPTHSAPRDPSNMYAYLEADLASYIHALIYNLHADEGKFQHRTFRSEQTNCRETSTNIRIFVNSKQFASPLCPSPTEPPAMSRSPASKHSKDSSTHSLVTHPPFHSILQDYPLAIHRARPHVKKKPMFLSPYVPRETHFALLGHFVRLFARSRATPASAGCV